MDFDGIQEIIENLENINPWVDDTQSIDDAIRNVINKLKENQY